MWGINPFVVGQVLGAVVLKDVVSGKHGAPKIIRDKIIVHVANQEIELAKAMARSVAQQDMDMYTKLKRELRDTLSEEEWEDLFES